MGISESASRNVMVRPGNDLLKGGHFCWFLAVGVVSTITDIALLYLLTECLGMWYLDSAAVSYGSGILVSFCLNKYITFHDTRTNPFRQFPLFAAISASSLILNLVILLVTVDLLSFHYLEGKLVAVAISFSWNYLGQSRFTFRKRAG